MKKKKEKLIHLADWFPMKSKDFWKMFKVKKDKRKSRKNP